MLARYKIYRGKRPADDPLPEGVRKDTRKHTRHCLRPAAEAVARYLAAPSAESWAEFSADYLQTLAQRFADDQTLFDELAKAATDGEVHIGCSCPTAKNPDVNHCHTVLALQFMSQQYPDLDVRLPRG